MLLKPSDYKKVIPLGEKFLFIMGESGYFHIQATKPDTVGVGLNTSPLGLAAYIIEKFSTWWIILSPYWFLTFRTILTLDSMKLYFLNSQTALFYLQ